MCPDDRGRAGDDVVGDGRTEYLIPPLDDEEGVRDWLHQELAEVHDYACTEQNDLLPAGAGDPLRRLSSYDVSLIASALARSISSAVQCSTGWRVSPDGT